MLSVVIVNIKSRKHFRLYEVDSLVNYEIRHMSRKSKRKKVNVANYNYLEKI